MSKEKNLIDALGQRYFTIDNDGGYCLYDREKPGHRSNHKYIGKFHISTNKDKYVFNDAYYADIDSLVKAMEEYNATLPFDAEIYNPILRNSYRVECALCDYLYSLGFVGHDRQNREYVLRDCYGEKICQLEVRVKDGTTEGAVVRRINTSNKFEYVSTESSFSDLDGAVAAVNMIVAPYVLAINAKVTNLLKNITSSRSAPLLNRTSNISTLSEYTEDGVTKMIGFLEEELKRLKGQL